MSSGKKQNQQFISQTWNDFHSLNFISANPHPTLSYLISNHKTSAICPSLPISCCRILGLLRIATKIIHSFLLEKNTVSTVGMVLCKHRLDFAKEKIYSILLSFTLKCVNISAQIFSLAHKLQALTCQALD